MIRERRRSKDPDPLEDFKKLQMREKNVKMSLPVLISIFALTFLSFVNFGNCVILTPPYFNLAEGKNIVASATCGEDIVGPELYCKLVGANAENDANINLIQGQVCDYCDANDLKKMHPAYYATDGMETWWQSPPLSRGMKYNEVNLTIELGQEFHVAYVFIRMGNSPRPGLWVLEKSTDYGETYTPWQYFSDTHADCERYFGKESLQPITKDDSVICTTEFSKIVPLEGGEIPISLLINRPSANTYFNSTVLQEWTRATNVRLRLLRTKNLLAHLMSVARQDPTVTRRYFYSIKDISIGGRCMCNGHADTCDPDPSPGSSILLCRCQHHTCGPQCATCCPGFTQKKWRLSTSQQRFICEACNCHNHTNECVYDPEIEEKHLSMDVHGNYEGGGVCQNCQHNTEGINCDRCRSGYFRPYGKVKNATDVCQACDCSEHYHTGACDEGSGRCECRPEYTGEYCDRCAPGHFGYPKCRPCECHANGTRHGYCEPEDGQCPCRPEYTGTFCNKCKDGWFNFPNCTACDCIAIGSSSDICDNTSGNCTCKTNFGGRTCNQCEDGYYDYPTCTYCKCDVRGTLKGVCDKDTGKCLCKPGWGGERCDRCAVGFWGMECEQCGCSEVGATGSACHATEGKCSCLEGFAGRTCEHCSPGYYKYPECLPCHCHDQGSIGLSCDNEGKCQCKHNFDGEKCKACKDGFYNFPICEECNCHPAGVVAAFAGCGSVPAGELCQCKERVTGRICDVCKPLYWNLNVNNPEGCEDCSCYPAGVLGGIAVCDGQSGNCTCKPSVAERDCSRCKQGSYNLQDNNLFGCTDCACDPGGAIEPDACDPYTGQCSCQPRVQGRSCNEPLKTHYFPTLYQLQLEAEDGRAPTRAFDKVPHRSSSRSDIYGYGSIDRYGSHDHGFYDGDQDIMVLEANDVRYGFNETDFPRYSWRGYAVFSKLQNEIINDVIISKPSLYRIILRYVNPTTQDIPATITVIPDNPSDVRQKATVIFKPTSRGKPAFVTATKGGAAAGTPTLVEMNPGRWSVSTTTEPQLLLDYIVLLPAAYYEATILTKKVESPCVVGEKGLCRHYTYPSISSFNTVHGEGGYISKGDERTQLKEYFSDSKYLSELNEHQLPLLTSTQPEIHLDLTVTRPGAYVLLIIYTTPPKGHIHVEFEEGQMHKEPNHDKKLVTIDARTVKNRGQAKAELLPCPYTSLCRQPAIDRSDRVALFNFDDNYVSVTLHFNASAEDKGVAIKSIVAIPYEKWSLDYIRPQSECIRKNQKCVAATFPAAPESRKVLFKDKETNDYEDEMTTIGPDEDEHIPDKYEDVTHLIYLGGTDASIDVRAKVKQTGSYVFVVHYYQPDYPEYETNILIQNGQMYEAKLPVKHCPSVSGCRSVVRQHDGSIRFQLLENVMLSMTQPEGRGVWLDYLLVIPSEHYKRNILTEDTFDQTREFISTCANNHFFINSTEEGFCREATFSLTADYNNGALPCQCDVYGSLSFECAQFGGQCECKPNVIGRKCESCKTGYFGFPDCRPCNCPSTATCEQNTGACICPPRVTGEKCDQCQALTYGFDPIIGCQECKCQPLGVERNNLQCDLFNGSCHCKPNIVGRRCERCEPGHHTYPYCDSCECDIRGTTIDVCDPVSAECRCKRNVLGQACDVCADGTFNLQDRNEEGCTRCFCFGRTEKCGSSNWYRNVESNVSNWKSVIVEMAGDDFQAFALEAQPNIRDESKLEIDLATEEAAHQVVYFEAPQSYTGNKLTSYGGRLNYTVFYTTGPFGTAVGGADVILNGAETYLRFEGVEQPPADVEWRGSLEIVEDNFVLPNDAPATREHLMIVLSNLQGIYIRTKYWEPTVLTRMSDISLDIAVEQWQIGTSRAYEVEQCICPPNYQGSSCEECAPGYYRSNVGPHGGYCVPCQCHDHSNECDVNTGICVNCQHNTAGDHCEMCQVGYHGNATNGTPRDCLICACPLPVPSNNFATSCDVSSDGERISCNCTEGYYGARCESCKAGYYGRPQIQGEICKPCDCSGNIDPTDFRSCDSVTGECRLCLNNTSGAACNLCAPGYYGDAIKLKDCQSCICDSTGTSECNHQTGECVCHPNVEGDKCDRCAVDHYGLASGTGCTACACDIASESSRCDETSGRCRCRDGVTGRACDRCSSGYWNYTETGCVSCGCNTEFSVGVGCNALTGQCECLEGVIGEKCDNCPYRWVLIEDKGCFGCDSCTHDLLDVTDSLKELIDPVITDFNTVALGHFTAQRLTYINETVLNLRPEVNLLDPDGIDLDETLKDLSLLEQETRNLNKKMEYSLENVNNSVPDAKKVKEFSYKVLEDVQKTVRESQNIVNEVEDLITRFESGDTVKTEQAIQQASQALEYISKVNLSSITNSTNKQLEKAVHLMEDIQKNFSKPIMKQNDVVKETHEDLDDFDSRLNELEDHANNVNKKADEINLINKQNRNSKVTTKAETVEEKNKEALDNLKSAGELLKNATTDLYNSRKSNERIGREQLELHRLTNELSHAVNTEAGYLDEAKEEFHRAHDHSLKLAQQAAELDNLLSDTRLISEQAVEAANAYKTIKESIDNAKNMSKEAADAAEKTIEVIESAGLETRTGHSQENSGNMLIKAREALATVQTELQPELNEYEDDVAEVEELLKTGEDGDVSISRGLERVPVTSLAPKANSANNNAEMAIQAAREALESLPPAANNSVTIANKLPTSHEDARNTIQSANQQLDNIPKLLPNITQLMETVKPKNEQIQNNLDDLEKKIKELNHLIATARDEANRIKVGVKFYRNTSIELRNPSDLASSGMTTKVSAYFRTANPNGFLMYLGNENGTKLRRTKSDDFMALEIENGYPVLTIDLGNGPEKIIGTKFVADEVWYQIIVERTGQNVKLTIREETEDGIDKEHVKQQTLTGSNAIFHLDPEQSKFFVGGYPASFESQLQGRDAAFEGEMEEIVVGNTPVSLWNFVDATGNEHGARERDKLVSLSPKTGYRFGGKGYAVFNVGDYINSQRNTIELSFKTKAKDGLLFLVGHGDSFLSLEIREGRVVYQYKLGNNQVATIRSQEKHNDGEWHTIEAIRSDTDGLLTVDNVSKRVKAYGTDSELKIGSSMYIGGHPGSHNFYEVTSSGFDGCIDKVSIAGTPLDLSTNTNAFDVLPGCPEKFAGSVSFSETHTGGYVKYPNASTNTLFKATLKFNSQTGEGVIFYVTNKQQNETLLLELANGELVLQSPAARVETSGEIGGPNGLRGEWHVITVTLEGGRLGMLIDDFFNFTKDTNMPKRKLTFQDIYFGGAPSDHKITTTGSFAGCIEDVILNGELINFINVTENKYGTLGSCTPDLLVPAEIHPARYDEPDQSITVLPTIEKEVTPMTFDLDHRFKEPDRKPHIEETTLPDIIAATTTPAPKRQCALLPEPATSNIGFDSGYFFGATHDSRLEWGSTNHIRQHKNIHLTLDFKTNQTDGVLMYVADNKHMHFVALFMQEGRLHFRYNVGSDPVDVTNDDRFNDGQWHSVKAIRSNHEIKLTVDEKVLAIVPDMQEAKNVSIQPPFYFGGTKTSIGNGVIVSLGMNKTFVGCLRNIQYGGARIGVPKIFGAIPCTDNLESGVFFTSKGGYIKIQEQFKVGLQIDIRMEIKPRNTSGVLLTVHGRKDYLVLQMIDGVIKLTVDNGKGPFEAAFTPNSPHYLCDGNWHSVQAVKSKNVVTLAVDKVFTDPTIGTGHMTNTRNGLFVGGHPYLYKLRGFQIRKTYNGCMRNLLINNTPIKLNEKQTFGNVMLNACPTD